MFFKQRELAKKPLQLILRMSTKADYDCGCSLKSNRILSSNASNPVFFTQYRYIQLTKRVCPLIKIQAPQLH